MGIEKRVRDLIAFWIFGLANNFAYVIMLSAADDIIKSQHTHNPQHNNKTNISNKCIENIGNPRCEKYMSTGAVLLADILPAMVIKYTMPFFMNRIPFGFRHLLVCLLQASSYLVVALSPNIQISLFGVVLAAMGSGLGEICYLALSSHYSKSTIASWSSGTGGAGIAGALAYAILTEPKFFDMSPRNALLVMLIVPIIFAITYWTLLTPVLTVHRINLFKISTWIVPVQNMKEKVNLKIGEEEYDNKAYTHNFTFRDKLKIIYPLLKYMVPLSFVYFAEYLINSGLSLNLAIFLIQSVNQFIPHIGIIFSLTFIEGIFGGASYANTFDRIHKEASSQTREFSLSIASTGDSIGISLAGFGSIIVHNYICKLYPIIYP
uniref:Battenin n=1 Tax=Meloidogyne javanica TaxID=6303 RepID=A0A915ML14_MELJA